jgi:hypothetical protein
MVIRLTVAGCLKTRQSFSLQSKVNLKSVWPLLCKRFEAFCKGSGKFPLMTQQQSDCFMKTLDWTKGDQREAAVLLLLANVEDKPSIVFTLRASHLPQHAAEISFPGGHFEADKDASLIHTALRETKEELLPSDALFEEKVRILGMTSRILSLKGTPVTPVIAALWEDIPLKSIEQLFPGNPSEVNTVFTISIQELLEKETFQGLPKNRFGMKRTPAFPTLHGTIWGLTALILRPVLHRLLKPIFFSIK